MVILKVCLKKAKKYLKKVLTFLFSFDIIDFAFREDLDRGILAGIAQLARACGSYPQCRWFKSDYRYHKARWSSG